MASEYRYIAVLNGKLKARNKTQAHLIVLSSFSIGARLMMTEHELAIEVIEVPEDVGKDNGHVPAFVEEVENG